MIRAARARITFQVGVSMISHTGIRQDRSAVAAKQRYLMTAKNLSFPQHSSNVRGGETSFNKHCSISATLIASTFMSPHSSHSVFVSVCAMFCESLSSNNHLYNNNNK